MATDILTSVVKFHLSLNVTNLARSIGFYEILFNALPAKRRADYAKFEAEEPPLVLSLNPAGHSPGGALNHMGIRLTDAEALVECQRRFEAHGILTQREEGVACCYARQTKFWVTDPDKNLWELYIIHEDLDERGEGHVPGHAPAAQAAIETAAIETAAADTHESVVWQHIIMQPLPERIDAANGSFDEVRLEGSFNLEASPAARDRFLTETFRVLRPGGQVMVHALVSDRPLVGRPALPGPAALVQHVPLEHEPHDALITAGFIAAEYTKLGETPCFTAGEVEMRELKLTARKPATVEPGPLQSVLYKGPLAQTVDDAGRVYARGRRVTLDAAAYAALRSSAAASSFVFFSSDVKPGGCVQ